MEPTDRDVAATALVLGVAAAAWFGWAQERPPHGWAVPLAIGSVVSLLVAAIAGARTWRYRSGDSAMRTAQGRSFYRSVVIVEVACIVVGSAVLGITGRSDYLAAWILFVVGVHFVPLGRLFRIRGLQVIGGLTAAVAAGAWLVGWAGGPAPSAVAGFGAGTLMVLFAASLLMRQASRASI